MENFQKNIRYFCVTYRQCKISVSHAKVGLYILYFILLENFQIWIISILQKQYFYLINYNSYFVIFTRKFKNVCKSVSSHNMFAQNQPTKQS